MISFVKKTAPVLHIYIASAVVSLLTTSVLMWQRINHPLVVAHSEGEAMLGFALFSVALVVSLALPLWSNKFMQNTKIATNKLQKIVGFFFLLILTLLSDLVQWRFAYLLTAFLVHLLGIYTYILFIQTLREKKSIFACVLAGLISFLLVFSGLYMIVYFE